MFNVRIIKQIHSKFAAGSSDDVYVYRDVALPAPPFIGLSIVYGDWDSGHIIEIQFDLESQTYKVYTAPDTEIYDLDRSKQLNRPTRADLLARLAVIVDDYARSGWILDK